MPTRMEASQKESIWFTWSFPFPNYMPLLLLPYLLVEVGSVTLVWPIHVINKSNKKEKEGKGKLCVEWCKPPQLFHMIEAFTHTSLSKQSFPPTNPWSPKAKENSILSIFIQIIKHGLLAATTLSLNSKKNQRAWSRYDNLINRAIGKDFVSAPL